MTLAIITRHRYATLLPITNVILVNFKRALNCCIILFRRAILRFFNTYSSHHLGYLKQNIIIILKLSKLHFFFLDTSVKFIQHLLKNMFSKKQKTLNNIGDTTIKRYRLSN